METANLYLAGLILTAIAWVSRELWHRRSAKRQAAHDASKILNERKTLLEELISKTQDKLRKNELKTQLDEVNTALLGLHTERLRRTLKDAGLPPEEALIAPGLSQLQPQQITQLKGAIAEVETLPLSDSIWDLLALGNAYYYAEQYQDAQNIYDTLLKLNPNDPAALNNRGIICDKQERYEEALANYNQSLELRPDDPDTITNRGVTYRHLKRYDKALADYNRSLELRPDDPNTLHNRGIIYSHLKRYDEALADFNHSLELKPDDPAILYDLACLFSLWGKTDNVLAYLEKAIEKAEKYREMAKTDEDFGNIREDPRFKILIEPD